MATVRPVDAGAHAATTFVRTALQSIVKDVRAARLQGGRKVGSGPSRFLSLYLSAIDEALDHAPVIELHVTAEGMWFGDVCVMEASERRADLVESLFAEGVRGLRIESGVDDEELLSLARLLVTPWSERHADEGSIEDAVWEADFVHVYFELVERVGDRSQTDRIAESRVVREIQGLVDEINQTATDPDLVRVRQDEFALLMRLRDELGDDLGHDTPAPGALASVVSARLTDEVMAVDEGRDLDDVDIAGLLSACAPRAAQADHVGAAYFHYVLGCVESAADHGSRQVCRLLEVLDPDGGFPAAFSDRLRVAARALAEPPLLGRLTSLIEEGDEATLRGPLFSLFTAVATDDDRLTLARVLPDWGVRVMADAWLLRAQMDDAPDTVRRLLLGTERGAVRLGLALAQRLDDPRLIEPIAAHAEGDDAAVREGALVALRRYQTPRIRELVRRHLDDPAETVRVEALRHAVANRDVAVAESVLQRLQAPDLSARSDGEVRALCVTLARLWRDRAERPLSVLVANVELNPAAARMALHGLRAIGSPSSRSHLARLGQEVPALADEARALLAGEPR